MRVPSPSQLRVASVVSVFGLAVAVACTLPSTFQVKRFAPSTPDDTLPTPAPTWANVYAGLTTDRQRDSMLASAVVPYGQSLSYDAADGAGDEQRLWVGPIDTGHLGPPARIEPQRGTYLLDSTSLAGGRVIARIINLSADSGYTPLNMLANDTLYWWVERRSGQWISAFVRTKSGPSGILVDSLRRTFHTDGQWRQALARWVSHSAEGAWGDCSHSGCCEALSLRIAAAQQLLK